MTDCQVASSAKIYDIISNVFNIRATGLVAEDLLIHLVIHAAKGHFREIQPKHVRDVELLVETSKNKKDLFYVCR